DPSVVLAYAAVPGASTASICTGTVITPTKVLTAAHCVDPRTVGSGNVFRVFPGTNLGDQPALAVSATAFDPGFDPSNLNNGHDVGIVTLAQPTSLTPIPYGGLTGGAVRIVGYGMNTHLNAPVIPSGGGTKRTLTVPINSTNATLFSSGDSWHMMCH